MADGSLIFDTKLDSSGLKTGLQKIKSGAFGMFTGLTAGLTAGATAMGTIVKSSLDARASVEQSIGGIKTLFGTAEMTLEEYAQKHNQTVEEATEQYNVLAEAEAKAIQHSKDAYQTAGMSADAYMQTVTSFAAALKQSTSDVNEAVEVGNMAVIDMSDNANKMGTNIQDIQNAYQGFAKQNYTMLDNLKLGYGGTKTEMERLLADATKLSGVEYNIDNLSDVYQAIHVIQTELGITGTTAKEASETVEGSAKAMQGAWENFLSGMGGAKEVAETFFVYAKNVLKMLGEIIASFAEEVPSLIDEIMTEIPSMIEQYLPMFLEVVVTFVTSIFEQLPSIITTMLPIVLDAIFKLAEALLPQLPAILEMVMTAIITMLPGIIKRLIEVIPMLLQVLEQVISVLLGAILGALVTILETILLAIWDWLGPIFEAGAKVMLNLIEGIKSKISSMIASAIAIGKRLVDSIWNGIKGVWSTITSGIGGLMERVWNAFTTAISKAKDIGKSIVDGIWGGISSGWDWLTNKVGEIAGGLFNKAKQALGIASPSKKFKWIGQMVVLGLEEGLEEVDGLLNGVGQSVNASIRTVGANVQGGTLSQSQGDNYSFNFYDMATTPDAIKRKFDNTMTFGLAGGIR